MQTTRERKQIHRLNDKGRKRDKDGGILKKACTTKKYELHGQKTLS